MNIAKYVASIGFNVKTKDIQKVDRALGLVEKKLRDFKRRSMGAFSIDLVNFNVNQQSLNRSLGNALDVASTRVPFEISRFVVNDRALLAALLRAARRLPRPPPGPNPPPHPPGPGPRPNGGGNPPPGSGRRSRSLIGAGVFGPLGYGALALAGGGHGLGALNRRNQEVVSAQLQSQAVVQQAGGTAEQGQASFQYLRSEANRIGFNYLDASGDYNKLISGLTGSGVGIKESQKVFSGFAELARVNKLDKTTQNRLFRALSQVAGKGKLQAEELTGQIAEALPGGTALFAEAYQKQIRGNKTGQEAIQQLLADMKKGKVTSDILTFAGTAASERANKGGALDLAQTASQAEQQRYQNAVSDLAVVASNAGVEEGFARIFRTLNAGLGESNGLVRGLAEGFNEVTKWADDLLLFPQSFIRALEGKDSVVADWLGVDATKQLQEDWKKISEAFAAISGTTGPSWLPSLQTVSKDIASQLELIAKLISGDFSGFGETLRTFVNSRYDSVVERGTQLPNYALRAAANLFETPMPQFSGTIFGGKSSTFTPKSLIDAYGLGRNPANGDSRTYNLFGNEELGIKEGNGFGLKPAGIDYNLPSSQFNRSFIGNDPTSLNQEQKDRAIARQEDEALGIVNNNNITLQVNVDAATLGNIDIEQQAHLLSQRIALNLEQVLVNFPNVE